MNPFRILISSIFTIAVVAAPWPIGGNWPFARTWLLLFALTALVLALVAKNTRRPMARFPLIWLPLLIGVALVWFQSSSLSGSVYQSLGAARPFAESVDAGATTISMYSAGTREKLVDLLLGIGIFFAASTLLRERSTIVPVFAGLTFVGAALSFYGVIQSLSWNGKIFWQYELLYGGRPFASFVNKNNASGFLIITFSAALFFFALLLFNWKNKTEPAGLVLADDHWENQAESKKTMVALCLDMFSRLQPKHLYCAAAIATIFAGVFVSLSRGGMVALACAAAVAFILFSRTSKWIAVLVTVALLGAGVGFVLISDQTEMVTSQLETLTDLDTQAPPRILHWQDAMPFAKENLALGIGAGNYRYASNSFQTFFFQRSYAHAESVYIETLVDMGVAGVAILLLAMLMVTISSFKLYGRSDPFDRALGASGLICLVGIGVASALDFGLYQPANTTAMAIMMGCIVGRASVDNRRTADNPKSYLRLATGCVLVVTIASCLWATYESYGIESRKRASRNIGLINEFKNPASRMTSRASFAKTKQLLDRAIAIRPDDMQAHFLLGEYNLTRFRAEASMKMNEDYLGVIEADPTLNLEDKPELESLWTTMAPVSIHRDYKIALRSDKNRAALIANDELLQLYWPQAWQSYLKAEELCPYTSKIQYRLAELSAFFDPNSEQQHIEASLERTLLNTKLMFSCGLLSLNSGDQKKAVDLWSKCLANPNSRPFERTIVEICQVELPMRSFFEDVLPQTPSGLINVSKKYFGHPDLMLPKRLLLVHTKRVIEKAELSEVERNYFSAEACQLSDEFKPAAEFYRKALELEPKKVNWRFNYAKCLHQSKQYDEAIRQLKICELENSSLHSSIKPLLARIRRDRAARN